MSLLLGLFTGVVPLCVTAATVASAKWAEADTSLLFVSLAAASDLAVYVLGKLRGEQGHLKQPQISVQLFNNSAPRGPLARVLAEASEALLQGRSATGATPSSPLDSLVAAAPLLAEAVASHKVRAVPLVDRVPTCPCPRSPLMMPVGLAFVCSLAC